MTLASCHYCPWEVDFPAGNAAAMSGLDRHLTRCPNAPAIEQAAADPVHEPDPLPQIAGVTWRSQALDALAQIAATGRVFTVFEVANYGVGEPPGGHHEWGRLARDAHHMGLIEHVGFTESKRPGTKASAVKTWRGTGRRTA